MQATVHSFVWAKLKAQCQAPGNPLLKQSFNQTISTNRLRVVRTLHHKLAHLHILQLYKQ